MGMLSLPETDFFEICEMDELNDDLRRALHHDHNNSFQYDVVNLFKTEVAKQNCI